MKREIGGSGTKKRFKSENLVLKCILKQMHAIPYSPFFAFYPIHKFKGPLEATLPIETPLLNTFIIYDE